MGAKELGLGLDPKTIKAISGENERLGVESGIKDCNISGVVFSKTVDLIAFVRYDNVFGNTKSIKIRAVKKDPADSK